MKIHLPFLLLFAVVTACSAAEQQSANGNSNDSSGSSNVNLSVDLSAEADEPESRSASKNGEQSPSSSSSSSSMSQSASTPFATYSSADHHHQPQQQAAPEFGMRNPPKSSSSSSSSSSQQSDHQKAFANYAAEQAQMTFEPSISSAYKQSGSSSSGVVTREFSPSVYRMSDAAHSGGSSGELLNAHESDQTYGQATSMSANEMDSPYYSKTTVDNGASNGENGAAAGDNHGFSPMSMSVDEAFRKYFPAQKQQEQADGGSEQQQQQQNSGDSYGSSQQQQAPKSSTQYITTYASDGAENVQQHQQQQQQHQQQQQQQPPQPTKELFSIDSLREIVDKQPLARPDPFDPPSPPLSAFLPPPPEGSIRETQPAAQSNAVPQFGSLGQQQELHHHQQQQQQLYSSQAQQQPIIHQQYAAPPQQGPSSYVYKETIVESPISSAAAVATSGSNGQVVHTSATSLNEESELPVEEGEDEGLPYNTENLDEEGKKLSYVYSRPVRLPDVTAGGKGLEGTQYEVTPSSGVDKQQYNTEMEHIYRKPVSYENEEDSADHGDEGGPYGSRQPQHQHQQQITPQGYEEGDKSMPYQQGVLSLPMNQPMVSMYNDEGGNYNGKPGVQQQQQQWTSDGRQAEYVDQQSGQKDQSLQAPIEYGGFVPIKKPGAGPQHLTSPFQPVVSGGGDVYGMEKPKQGGSNFFNLGNPQPNYQLSAGVIPPDHSGYVGPNNLSPMTSQILSGYQAQQPQQQQQQQSKYGNQVGNFLSKFPNLRFKPLYGKDAMKKLRELGISEDEFYGTVNKILKNSGVGPRPGGGPIYSGQLPFMPKANLYRAPPKNGAPHHRHPSSMGGLPSGPMVGGGGSGPGGNKMRPLGNGIPDEFDFNYFKDTLPPGASYNPRDVGLDESVLAQIQLQDSGIGGYRFPTMIPTGTNLLTGSPGSKAYRPGGRPSGGPLSAFSKGKSTSGPVASVPHAMNSIAMPFVLAGPRGPFGGSGSHHSHHHSHHNRGRLPYSATGKGFRSQYGYRAAASELKPQFVLPKGTTAFKFLGQPVGGGSSAAAGSGTTSLSSALLSSALLDDGGSLGGGGSGSLGNIFGIRSIKGIKSLVSYLTGGVSG